MSKSHKHLEPPRDEQDAKMLNKCGADEAIYILLGIKEKNVVCIGACDQMSLLETIELLESALRLVKGELFG